MDKEKKKRQQTIRSSTVNSQAMKCCHISRNGQQINKNEMLKQQQQQQQSNARQTRPHHQVTIVPCSTHPRSAHRQFYVTLTHIRTYALLLSGKSVNFLPLKVSTQTRLAATLRRLTSLLMLSLNFRSHLCRKHVDTCTIHCYITTHILPSYFY